MSTRRMGPRLSSIASVCVSVSLLLCPAIGVAAPGPGPSDGVEGPARPAPASEPGPSEGGPSEGTSSDAAPSDAAPSDAAPSVEPPPPTFEPSDASGIEFRVEPPPVEDQRAPEREPPLAVTFPDPGVAPNDGAAMMVLGSTTIGLTLVGLGAGLAVGINNQTPLEWLLPSTLIPTVGLLAFAGGGLGLGIQRARAHRRWEIGARVVGTPQGGGLAVGGSFMLLTALALVPSGAFALNNGEIELGATLVALGSMAAVAMPIMFSVSTRRARDYARTGGWYRRPLPPLPQQARLQLAPRLNPLPGGAAIGVAGRF